MSFERALQEHLPAPAIGEVRLRYDGPLLVAEVAPSITPAWLPDALWLAAGGVALLALGAVTVGSGLLVPLTLSGLFAALLFASSRVRARQRPQRRFVLNFADQTLRVERPARWLWPPRTRVAPFDEVRELYLVRHRAGRLQLEVELGAQDAKHPERYLLIAGARAAEEPHLRTLGRLLRGAFGLPAT